MTADALRAIDDDTAPDAPGHPLLELDDFNFSDAWTNLDDEVRAALPDDVRRQCFERKRKLTSYIDKGRGIIERTQARLDAAFAADNAPLCALSLPEFLAHEFKPRVSMLGPITTQALGMVHGYRGGSKTWAGVSAALAAASGGEVFGWKAPRPVPTIYCDGEMAGADLQNRVRLLSAANETGWDGATLRILTPDLQDGSLPDLATRTGQIRLEAIIGDAELIFLDNLSAWVRGTGEENAAESWLPMLDWLLRMRAQGRSVVVVHHSGKTGLQRGTSKREDVLDFVIALRRPTDYQPQEGARFELHFEKSRGLHGAAVAPFEAQLITDPSGHLTWTTRTIEVATMDRVVSLARDGLSQKDIATELALNKSTVSRTMRKAEQNGLLQGKSAAEYVRNSRGH